MKKIVAIFLLIAITTVFVSCGKGDNDGNQTTLNTNINNVESTTEGTTEPQGIALTTDPTKMAQWGYATEFIPTEYTEPTIPTVSVPAISESQLERPSVNISQATVNPENTTTTNGGGANNGGANNGGADGGNSGNNSGPTVSEITTPTDDTPTTQLQRMPKSLGNMSSVVTDRNDAYVVTALVEISPDGWDGGVVPNSDSVVVSYAGDTLNCPCELSNKLSVDGRYLIKVDVSSLKIPSGTGFSVTIPEGYVRNAYDTQYNWAKTIRF